MAKLDIHQIPVMRDNYAYLLHEAEAGLTAALDPAVHEPVLEALEQKGWTLTHILNTHHHNDHVGGNIALKEATGCTIVGARIDKHRIPGIDIEVGDSEQYALGNAIAKVMEVPGHTDGHIVYWFEESDALFCGDTMFAMGCGKLSEGTADQLWASLTKLTALPDETRIYCAHEYTQANGDFALSVEPSNQALVERMQEVDAKRAQGISTVPSLLGDERKTNPFLRPDSEEIQRSIGQEKQDALSVFAEIRKRKDSFNANNRQYFE
jgi:hydroxyacylglutathione hydrolase